MPDPVAAAPHGPPRLRRVAAGAAGDYALLELDVPAGAATPPHVAEAADLALGVLTGALELRTGIATRRLGPGAWATIGRGEPRAIAVLHDARIVCVTVPSGLEGLVGTLLDGPLDPDDRDVLLTAAGVRLLPRGWRPGPR
jgi:quercetin dioxygenase-like cupin family protein